METEERMELVVRTASKLSHEDRIRVAEMILESPCKEHPDTGARYLELIRAAERAVGCKVDGTRRASSVMIRRFCAYRLREEGHYIVDIGQTIGVNHATVCHYVRQMEACFEFPFYYHRDLEMYHRFMEELEDHVEQVRQ